MNYILSLFVSIMLYQNFDLQLYSDVNTGIEIRHPKTWEFMENPQTTFIFIEPVSGFEDRFRENVNLIINGDEGLSVSEYTGASKIQMKSQLSGFREIETKYLAINGLKASRVIYGHRIEDLEIRVFYYVILNGGKAYNVTFSALEAEIDTYEAVFEEMMSSFRLKVNE